MTETTKTAPHIIERVVELSVPRERVWQAITEPEELARWFPQKAEWELEPGGEGIFTWDGYGDYGVRVEAVEAPTYLAWRWANEAGTSLDRHRRSPWSNGGCTSAKTVAPRCACRNPASSCRSTATATRRAGTRSWASWRSC